jgi:hypothetical protein
MNIHEAQVPQEPWSAVTKVGDTFTIPPKAACRRHWHLAATVLYDLIQLKADWATLEQLAQELDLPNDVASLIMVEAWVKAQGRIAIDTWTSPVSWRGHVEPVEQKGTSDD